MDRLWKSTGRILGPIINACLPHQARHRPRTSQVSKRTTYLARGSILTTTDAAFTNSVLTFAGRLKSAAIGVRNSASYAKSSESKKRNRPTAIIPKPWGQSNDDE